MAPPSRIMDSFSPYDAVGSGVRYTVDSGVPDHYLADSGISVTPATPPNSTNGHEVYDPDLEVPQTPVSDPGSYWSGYSPAMSDVSHGLQPEHLYHSDPFTDYQLLPLSPSSSESPLQMFAHMALDDAAGLNPEAPALQLPYSYTQYSSFNSRDALSPMLPLLTFSDSEHWPSFEDTSGASSALSPLESSVPILFDSTAPPHSTFGLHSRAQSDLTASTASNDRLTAPPRRHSFNTQRSGAKFFVSPESVEGGSGLSTPETPSSLSPIPSPSAAGTTLDLPILHSEVASPAGVHAAQLRRKKPAKFRCDICPATFTTKHNLKNHYNSHTGTKPYACRLCGVRFTTLSVKTRHEKNHDEEDWAQLG
ncbi:hypothetical protein B0H12DRAFT_1324508 [Mycena haematopus]|nr:hypothetical protein B0H12DRAFT_1324508 [Mycena haematopus]